MKVQEIFQGTFKFISIVRQILYLRRQIIDCDPETSGMRKTELNRDVEVLKKCNSDFEFVDNA
jgi:hypothetical protein